MLWYGMKQCKMGMYQKKSRLFQIVDEPILRAITSWILGFSILFSWTLILYRYLNLD